MIHPSDLNPSAVWRAAVTTCVVMIFVTIISVATVHAPVGSALSVARFVEIAVCLILLALLLPSARSPAVRPALIVYALAFLPQLPVRFLFGAFHAASGRYWEPFIRHKFLFIFIAVVSPGDVVVSSLVIAALCVELCFEYWGDGFRNDPRLGLFEPWVTLLFAVAAIAILMKRAHHILAWRRCQLAVEQSAAAERYTRMSMAIRDLMNSPLQVLQFSFWLIREGRHTPEVYLRVERALRRIERINHELRHSQEGRIWRTGEESFDPHEILRTLTDPDTTEI